MAGIRCIAQTAEVALVAATAKTVLQVTAPTNQRIVVKRWGVYFDGTATNNEPVQVVLMRQTTSGTMTSLTPKAINIVSETLQATAQHTATAEPTSGDTLDIAKVHPQTSYEVLLPLGDEIIVAGGGRIGIVCTAADAVNVIAKIWYEE